jgi:hypothetical protein
MFAFLENKSRLDMKEIKYIINPFRENKIDVLLD